MYSIQDKTRCRTFSCTLFFCPYFCIIRNSLQEDGMDKKSYDNGSDFSFVEQKVREVQTTIENAVKTSNYQELNQSITRMVNSTLKQYQKEHPEKAGYRKPEAGAQKVRGTVENTETHPELYGNTGGEKVKDILLIVFGGIISGSMAIGLLTVQILQAVMGHGGIGSTVVTLIGTLAGVGMIGSGCTGLGRLKRLEIQKHWDTKHIVVLKIWRKQSAEA